MGTVVKGKFKQPRWRLLREYDGVAKVGTGYCRECEQDFHPGERYWAEVWVWESRDYGKKNHIDVRKFHENCPNDPEFDRSRKHDEDRGEETGSMFA